MRRTHLLILGIISAALTISLIGCGGSDEPETPEGHTTGSAGVAVLEKALKDDPNNVQLRINLAQAYKQTNQLDQARETLSKVPENLQDAELNEKVKQLRIEIKTQQAIKPYEEALRADDPQKRIQLLLKARQLANEALAAAPDSAPLHLLLGKIAYLDKKYDQALQHTNKALSLAPDFLEAYSVKVECLRATGERDQAFDVAHKALKKAQITDSEESSEQEYKLCLQLARMSYLQGRLKKANTDDEPAALDYYKMAVEAAQKPDSKINAHFQLGDFYLKLNQYQDAQEQAKAIDAIDRKNTMVEYLNGRAQLERAKGEQGAERKTLLDKAIDNLSVFARSSDPDVLFYLGSAYSLRGGRNEQALATYQKALSMLDQEQQTTNLAYKIYCGMAEVSRRQTKYDEAENYARMARRIQPKNDPKVLAIQADIFFQQHNYSTAASLAAKVAELQPNSKQAKLFLARCRLLDGQPNLALENINQVHLAPEDGPDLYNLKGNICYQLRQYKEALDAFEQAISLDPTYSAARNGIAQTLIASDRKNEAIEYLTEYAEQFPRQPEAPYFLGTIYENDGKLDKALEFYHQALTRDGEYFPAYAAARLHLIRWSQTQAQNDLDQAVSLWKQQYAIVRKTQRPLPQVHINLAFALMFKGNHQEAAAYLDDLAQKSENNKQLYQMGRIVNAVNHQTYDEARDLLEQVDANKKAALEQFINTFERNPAASEESVMQTALDLIQANQYDVDKPEEFLKPVLENDYLANRNNLYYGFQGAEGNKQYSLLCMVINALHAKDYDAAQNLLPQITAGKLPVEMFIKQCSQKPALADDVIRKLALGIINKNSQSSKMAEDNFKQALQLMPNSALLLSRLAGLYKQIDNRDQLRQICLRLTEIAPDYGWPYYELATLALEQQNYEQAAGYYQKILQINSDSTEAYAALANINLARGKFKEAIDLLKKAAEITPNDPDIKIMMLQAYKQQQNDPAAREMLDELVEQIPDDPRVRREQVGYLLGQAWEARQQENVERAQQLENQALSICNGLLAQNPEDTSLYLLKTRILLQEGTPDTRRQAVRLLENALEINDLDPRIYLTLADIFRNSGQLAAAEQILRQGHNKIRQSEVITRRLAEIYINTNNHEDAEQLLAELKDSELKDLLQVKLEFSKALTNPQSNTQTKLNRILDQTKRLAKAADTQTAFEALCMLGRIHINGQDAVQNLALAQQYYEEAKAKMPDALEPNMQLAALYFTAGEYAKSIEMLRNLNQTPRIQAAEAVVYQANENLPEAEARVRAALEEEEQDNTLRMMLANILAARGRIFSAGAELDSTEAAVALASEEMQQSYMQLVQNTTNPSKLALLLNKAIFYNIMGWRDEVPNQYKAAAELAQNGNLFLVSYHAGSLVQANKLQEARNVLAAIEDKSTSAKIAIADILRNQGETDQAMQRYQQALAQRPQDVSLMLKMADLYAELAQKTAPPNEELLKRAIQFYERALAIRPGNAGIHLRMGMIYQQLEQNEKAIEHFEQVYENAPESSIAAQALNNAAWLYAHKAEPEYGEAIAAARRAKMLAPEQPEVLDTFGWVLYQAGLVEEAADNLKIAAEMLPDNGTVQYHYARALAGVASGLQAQAQELRTIDDNATEEQRTKAMDAAQQKEEQAQAKRNLAITVLQKAVDLKFQIKYDKRLAQDLLTQLQNN